MPLTIDLSAKEARLLHLAVFRILGDPRWRSGHGSDPGREGLIDAYEQTSEVTDALALRVEPATVDLLDSALRRLISELKNYELLSSASAGERSVSMVEGFDAQLARLFPKAATDRNEMDRLLPELLELRRDFSRARTALAEVASTNAERQAAERAPRWQFWRR